MSSDGNPQTKEGSISKPEKAGSASGKAKLAEKHKNDTSTEESSLEDGQNDTTSGSSETNETQSSVEVGQQSDTESEEDESDEKVSNLNVKQSTKNSRRRTNMSQRKTSTPRNGSKASQDTLTFTPRQQTRSKNATPRKLVPRDFTKDQGKHDCVLNIGDKKMFCTKVDLLLWSPWFKHKINSRRNAGNRIAEIKITSQSYEDMLEMLLIINPPFKPIDDENVEKLLSVGKDFEMQELLSRAEKYLLTLSPSPSNLLLSQQYNLPLLRKKCVNHYKIKTWVEWGEDDDLFDYLDDDTKLCLLTERIRYLEKKSIHSGKTCCVLELALGDGVELMEQFNQSKKTEKSSKKVKDFIIKGSEELLFKIKDMVPPKKHVENAEDFGTDLDTSEDKSSSQESEEFQEKCKPKQRGNFKRECSSTDSRPHPKTKIASLWDRLSREEEDEESLGNISQNSNTSQTTSLGLPKSEYSTPRMCEVDETRPISVKEFKKAVLMNLNRNKGKYFDSSEEENIGFSDEDNKRIENESEDFVFSDEDDKKNEKEAKGAEKEGESIAEQKKALLGKLNNDTEQFAENEKEETEQKKKKKKKKKSSKQSGDEEEKDEEEATKKSKKKKKKKSKEPEDEEAQDEDEESGKKKKKKKKKGKDNDEEGEEEKEEGDSSKKKKKKSKEKTEEGKEESGNSKKKKKKKSKDKSRQDAESRQENEADDPLDEKEVEGDSP